MAHPAFEQGAEPAPFATWSALGISRSAGKLLQRPAGHGGELAREAIRHLPGDRQPALALEPLDGDLGVGIDGAGRLDLAVAVFSKLALDRNHALRRSVCGRLQTNLLNLRPQTRRCLGWLGAGALDGREQGLVRLGAGFEPTRLLEVANRGIGARSIAAVNHAIIEAAPRQLALDVGNDLGRWARLGPASRFGRPRARQHLGCVL